VFLIIGSQELGRVDLSLDVVRVDEHLHLNLWDEPGWRPRFSPLVYAISFSDPFWKPTIQDSNVEMTEKS
jgi:hypothetical protein